MELPIKFPSDADIIREEVARFRALSVEERHRSICGMLNSGQTLMRHSPVAQKLYQYSEEQENLKRKAIQEVLNRYGY